MEKFLSVPVTNEQNQLVSANNVVLVEQASTTTVAINYANGRVVTLTHATAGAGDETQRDYIQDSIVAVLKQKWDQPTYQCDALPYVVSGIAVASMVVPTA